MTVSSVKVCSLKVAPLFCTPCRAIGSGVRTVHTGNNSGTTAAARPEADALNSECLGETDMDFSQHVEVKSGEGDLLGGFYTSKPPTFRLFPL